MAKKDLRSGQSTDYLLSGDTQNVFLGLMPVQGLLQVCNEIHTEIESMHLKIFIGKVEHIK